MRALFAIILLTWKAAFRFKLFWVLAVLLLGSVLALPPLVEHDGTASGFTQIVLTYTLGVVTVLLGAATLWLACGTLARDVEECQIQLVAVKPVPRWQIWLGKWLGIVSLDAALLALAGAAIYTLLEWRAQSLTLDQQAILRSEVLVARGSLKEAPFNYEPIVERLFQAYLTKKPVRPEDRPFIRQQIEEQVKAGRQLVPPGYPRQWKINAGHIRDSLGDQPLFIRTKFYAAQTNASGTYPCLWIIGPPDAPRLPDIEKSMATETFHQLPIPARAIGDDGQLIITVIHYNNTVLLFPLDDGLEVLYREGGFGLNFARGLGIILCWLGLLAAVGLAAASFLSFPVAAFCSVALLIMVFSSGTMAASVAEGTVIGLNHETGKADNPVVDSIMLPVFKGILHVINLAKAFSPVDMLSAGRSITWGMLAQAFAQVVLLLGGACALFGIIVFTRRELATAQGTS